MTHDGHRSRLRKRFLSSPDSFEDHELLELILFYVIPRKNTNDIAHNLLNRFGNIKGVLDANIETLTSVEDIGESTALYIKAIAKLLSKYEFSENNDLGPLTSPQALATFLKNLFIGTDNECSFILLFDNSRRLLTCEKIGEGFATANTISLRKIVSLAISNNAASAILVHNHPKGKGIPSGEDIYATNRIKQTLNSLDVTLLEHFIVAEDECNPIMVPQKAYLYNPHKNPPTE